MTPAELIEAVETARDDHTAALGRLLAAEAKHDKARTTWGRDRAHKKVLAAIAEARHTEDAYRGRQLDAAMLEWQQAMDESRRLHAVAQHAIEHEHSPQERKRALDAADEALERMAKAEARVQQWRPVP